MTPENNSMQFPPKNDPRIIKTVHPMEGLAQEIDGKTMGEAQEILTEAVKTEYRRDKDGSLHRITPKKGEAVPQNWRDRAVRAEPMVINLVEERNKTRDLILEACVKLASYGFTCEHGPLEECKEFMEIQAFAAGTPMVVRPPLETMRLNGIRAIKKIHETEKSDEAEAYLECGHIVICKKKEIPGFEKEKEMECPMCVRMLQDRQLYGTKENADEVAE